MTQPPKVGAGGTAQKPPRRRIRRLALIAVVFGVLAIAGAWATYLHFDRTSGELLRYAERRLIGHTKLEFVIHPIFNFLRPFIERPVTGPIPTLGKGQKAQSLSPQKYDNQGRPLPTETAPPSTSAPTGEVILLSSSGAIQAAIAQAGPGQILEIAPGTYSFTQNLRAQSAGTPQQPIIVRAATSGSVNLEFKQLEGFHVTAPFWIFENLNIRGNCSRHHDCEHAFHVVGKARSVVIRNNRIEDFNAQIKVNGLNNNWPDDGLIQFNTLNNNNRRETHLPVTPIDIVGADRWMVADNIISNFIKGDGNQVSYGVFMKGAGSEGRIERNLIVCTTKDISQPGTRVGLSFGGGGTGKGSCRDQRCITEHSGASATNNIIAHCNDFGIYINSSNQTIISRNELINTYGIDVRFPSSSARIVDNVYEGSIRSRDGAQIEIGKNSHKWKPEFQDTGKRHEQ
jgi:hypothetical protein